jgi:hypothetical protein
MTVTWDSVAPGDSSAPSFPVLFNIEVVLSHPIRPKTLPHSSPFLTAPSVPGGARAARGPALSRAARSRCDRRHCICAGRRVPVRAPRAACRSARGVACWRTMAAAAAVAVAAAAAAANGSLFLALTICAGTQRPPALAGVARATSRRAHARQASMTHRPRRAAPSRASRHSPRQSRVLAAARSNHRCCVDCPLHCHTRTTGRACPCASGPVPSPANTTHERALHHEVAGLVPEALGRQLHRAVLGGARGVDAEAAHPFRERRKPVGLRGTWSETEEDDQRLGETKDWEDGQGDKRRQPAAR